MGGGITEPLDLGSMRKKTKKVMKRESAPGSRFCPVCVPVLVFLLVIIDMEIKF